MPWPTARTWLQSLRATLPLPERAANVRFLHHEALADPSAAIASIEKEQLSLAVRLPEYLNEVREETRGVGAPARALHQSTVAVLTEVERFSTRLAAREPGPAASLALARLTERSELLRSLSDSVAELTEVIGRARRSGPLAALTANIAEGLHVVLLTSAETMAAPDAANLELLHDLTADRSEVMGAVRSALLRGEQTLSLDDHQALFTSTSLFERVIRLLRRLRIVLGPPSIEARERGRLLAGPRDVQRMEEIK